MRVTKIEAQKRRPGRKNIFIDGSFALGVSDETLLRCGLRTGDVVEPGFVEELRSLEERSEARASALRLLSRRPRSAKELADRLRRKQFRDETVDTVIRDLTSAGLLDDENFARMLIRDQLTLRPSGEKLLSQKLRRLGVDREVVSRAVAESIVDEGEAAGRAAEKYLRSRSTTLLETPVVRNRLIAFLTRRGFSWETIKTTVDRILGEAQEPA